MKRFGLESEINQENILEIENRFYLVKNNIFLKNLSKNSLYSANIFLGKKSKERFIPSPNLIDMISKKTKQKTSLNKKTSWLYICGRDVFKEQLDEFQQNTLLKLKKKKKDYIIINNNHDEPIGYGIITGTNKDFIKNKFDVGDLLRREMTKKRY